MVIRVAVRETESSERLVEEFSSLFGRRRVTLRSSGEIELELSGEASEPLNQALTAIEGTLEEAGIATAKVWVGEHSYMLERPVPEQPAATAKPQFVARSLGPDRRLSEETKGLSSGAQFIRTVNNSVYDVLVKLETEDGEFWCECDDPSCERKVTLTLREYAALRERIGEPLLSRSHAGQVAPITRGKHQPISAAARGTHADV
jgi:hypothetical protein